MMKVLSIGNSFSQDAQRYLSRLSAAAGVKIKAVNLYIGGCNLRTHYLNMLNGSKSYGFEFCGEPTGIKVSLAEALTSDDWDVITLQQASRESGKYDTYIPYIKELAAFVRKYCPKAKLMIHETWAYEDASDRLKTATGFNTADEMLAAVRTAYKKAATDICADGIIPSGEAMMLATKLGIQKIHRDSVHSSLGAGRYLLALTWLGALTGKDIAGDRFEELDEPISETEREIAISAARCALGYN